MNAIHKNLKAEHPNLTRGNVASIEDYSLKSARGSHLRIATKIVFRDGSERRYTERMSKRVALAQLPA
jgi:DNA/RNA endonuclease G (NUC1)